MKIEFHILHNMQHNAGLVFCHTVYAPMQLNYVHTFVVISVNSCTVLLDDFTCHELL